MSEENQNQGQNENQGGQGDQSTGAAKPVVGLAGAAAKLAGNTAGENSGGNQGQPAPNQENPAGENVGQWFWADGTPGEGDRPGWLKDKYKTVEAQAKAYAEAEKRLGAFTGAPKDGYDTSFLDNAPIDKEAPYFNKILETAKELNISQEAMQKLLGVYAEYESLRVPNPEEELKKLGDGAADQVVLLDQWVRNNFTQEEYSHFQSRFTTAEDFKFFMKLRDLTKEPKIPNKPTGVMQGQTIANLKKQIEDNYQDYVDNKNGFRDKIDAQMAALY